MNKKVNILLELANIYDYKQLSEKYGIVHCDNVFSSYSIPIDYKFQIPPSCGDVIKFIVISSVLDKDLIEVVPIEIKIRGMRTKFDINYEKLINNLGLELKTKKKVFSFSALSEKDVFIQKLETNKNNFLRTHKKNSLH